MSLVVKLRYIGNTCINVPAPVPIKGKSKKIREVSRYNKNLARSAVNSSEIRANLEYRGSQSIPDKTAKTKSNNAPLITGLESPVFVCP